ncbi:hypothetical protein P7C71_g6192, partial [Lecanoromycetidae sp. Uapishka_2]
MDDQARGPRQGDLSWRLSSHPITLLFFLGFRICAFSIPPIPPTPPEKEANAATASLLVYMFGVWLLSKNFVLVFIITMLLLAADFYYSKNIAGRRLVGLRWWNEVDTSTGDSHWVFESQDRSADGGPGQNATDKSQASHLASSAMYGGGFARSVAGGVFSRLFTRS